MNYLEEYYSNYDEEGRYSIALAKEGFEVHAVELTEHNLGIMNSKKDL